MAHFRLEDVTNGLKWTSLLESQPLSINDSFAVDTKIDKRVYCKEDVRLKETETG